MNREKVIQNKYLQIPLKLYHSLPDGVRSRLYIFLRRKVFRDSKTLAEDGFFNVHVPKGRSFKIKHFGGSIEQEIFCNGLFKTWESELGWLWLELSRFNDVIIDIGANKGIYSLVAKSLNPQSKVIAFEPSINTFDKLVFNVELNDFDIRCEKLAVSNKSQEQTYFDIPNENQTTASLSSEKMKDWDGYNGEIMEYPVDSIKLADYIEQNSLKKIDLIKIDIEMHEPEAFEGMGEYLYRFEPIVVFEILSESVAMRLGEIIYLEHFLLFHLKKDQKAEKLSQFQMPVGSIKNAEWNYVLVPKSRQKEVREKTSLFENLTEM